MLLTSTLASFSSIISAIVKSWHILGILYVRLLVAVELETMLGKLDKIGQLRGRRFCFKIERKRVLYVCKSFF